MRIDLVSIFPELQPLLPEATPSASVDPESDRRRLFHVLAQAITVLARTQPVFIAFEDVHWSDDATLELVFHLARTHATQRVVVALTYRGEEAGPRLARLVTHARSEDGGRARAARQPDPRAARRGDGLLHRRDLRQ